MPTGRLDISFDSRSVFLADHLPVEIRDATNTLVARSQGSTGVDLPEGLYVVNATLPGGRLHSEVVSVLADTPTDLVMRTDAGAVEPDELEWSVINANLAERAHVRWSFGDDLIVEEPPVAIIELHGCALRASDIVWEFEPEEHITETPYVVFSVGGRQVSTSVPVNPSGPHPESACIVAAVTVDGVTRLITSFAPQRRVAATLEGLVRANNLVAGTDLVDAASNLLLHKYGDPPAAALGGLTLHRIGHLQERRQWIDNLASDFPWLPDGRLLLAALLAHDPDPGERQRGLELLLEVAGVRLMFSDGFALLLKLLRRWPDEDAGKEQRHEALSRLGSMAVSTDWTAVTLTLYEEEI